MEKAYVNDWMSETLDSLQAELLLRIARRDKNALGEFYNQTAQPLFSIAYRMLHCSEEAEDVLQDVFLQIWLKANEFDPKKGRPFSWAWSITRNRCIDRLRVRQRRECAFLNYTDNHESQQSSNSDLGHSSFMENETEAIQSAIDNLPKEQRQAIELAFFVGMTHSEIAESLNEPMGTIKARVRRGMLKLSVTLRRLLVISAQP